MIERFTGTCQPFSDVSVEGAVAWIEQLPFSLWPQQWHPEGKLRPAMVTDLLWHGFGEETNLIVFQVMNHFLGCASFQRMLSVVMPGDIIEPHKDHQADYWLARVHVPLMTNPLAVYRSGGDHHMEVGQAYLINTLAEHAVSNDGETPRIHLMFDVRT